MRPCFLFQSLWEKIKQRSLKTPSFRKPFKTFLLLPERLRMAWVSYAHLAFVRFDHSVCRVSLITNVSLTWTRNHLNKWNNTEEVID